MPVFLSMALLCLLAWEKVAVAGTPISATVKMNTATGGRCRQVMAELDLLNPKGSDWALVNLTPKETQTVIATLDTFEYSSIKASREIAERMKRQIEKSLNTYLRESQLSCSMAHHKLGNALANTFTKHPPDSDERKWIKVALKKLLMEDT